jgi:Tfp pilus assembly protein PilF
MRRSVQSFLCWVFFVLALTLTPSFAGDAQWVEVRSEHFTVITDAGEKSGRQVAERFEQMRMVFGLLFGRQKINQPVPLTIVAFRNTKEIRQYSPMFQGKVVEVAGFFQQAEDEDFIALDMSLEDSWRTVLHEYAHVLLNSNFQATAPWFDEGFAEFLSSMKFSAGLITVGETIPDAQFLSQSGKLHLQELFEVQHHSETYNVSGSRREMFYVQSWAVVHFLFDKNLIAQASKYFHLTNDQKMPVPQAVQSAFGISVAELEKQVLAYLHDNQIKIIRLTGKEKFAVTTDFKVRVLNPIETRTELADLHLHSQDHIGEAIKEFDDVLRTDPNQAEAHRGLGYAYLQQHDMSKAGEQFREAAKLGSKDARVYYYSAFLLQQGVAGLTSPELQQDLHRAIELDPQYADAYALLGMSLSESGKREEGAQSLRHAVELEPRNQNFRLNYAVALLNQQKVDEAEALFQSVANSDDQGAAMNARAQLTQIERYKSMTASLASENAGAAPQVEPIESRSAASREDGPPPQQIPPSVAKYLQGTLVGVDCSSPPQAILTVLSGGRTWKMKVADTDHAILIGEDKFSCSWGKKKVAINYRPSGASEGNVISLEIQ